jgi:dTMP kinase
MMKGRLITFEGIDGSGKTTQVERLCEYIKSKGLECVVVREPGGTPEGEEIRRILLDKGSKLTPEAELFLFLASRSLLTKRIIIPALEEGKVVISDRYADSSLAYQGYGRGIDLSFVEKANHVATCSIEPDLIFYIDIPVEEALKRKKYRDRMEKEEFLKRVREGYIELARMKGYIVLNGTDSVENIWKSVKENVDRLLGGADS